MAGRALIGMRVRLAPDVTYDPAAGVLWTPRRNPIERLFARLLRPRARDHRVRVALDAEGRRVFDALRVGPRAGVPVTELARNAGAAEDQDTRDPRLAALLRYLDSLVAARCLVAEPI